MVYELEVTQVKPVAMMVAAANLPPPTNPADMPYQSPHGVVQTQKYEQAQPEEGINETMMNVRADESHFFF